MSDWTFIDKFGKDIAKSTGVTTRSFWLAAMTGCVSGASLEGPKERFDEEDMDGFSEKAKQWFRDHPEEVKKLLLCIAAPSIAVSITPMLLGIAGFGALGPILGKSFAAIFHTALGIFANRCRWACCRHSISHRAHCCR